MIVQRNASQTCMQFKDAAELANHIAKLTALLASNLGGNNNYASESCTLSEDGVTKAAHISFTIGLEA